MATEKSSKFGVFTAPCRVWAVASIHGNVESLKRLHKALREKIEPGDKLAYLGNVLGRGPAIRAAMDEVISFRREFLAIKGNDVPDIALLRGAQEEMWHKLLQLQFSVGPAEVLEWMLGEGLGATIEAYGGRPDQGFAAARQGTVALNRWTNELRAVFDTAPGHRDFMSALKHAAYTRDGALIFVSAGIDRTRPLDAQSDTLWWGWKGFAKIEEPYYGTKLVVRGYDPSHEGLDKRAHTLSIDSGCGFGGKLTAACVTTDGEVAEVLEG